MKIDYLRQLGTGRIYPFSHNLARRSDMELFDPAIPKRAETKESMFWRFWQWVMKKFIIILACAFMLGCATTGNLPVEKQMGTAEATVSEHEDKSFLGALLFDALMWLPDIF